MAEVLAFLVGRRELRVINQSCSFYFRRIMFRKQSTTSHSQSVSNRAHLSHSKICFQTVYKRRNDTIASSQLYYQSPVPNSSKSSRVLSQSLVLDSKDIQVQEIKELDIREYVKKMGANKMDLESKPTRIQTVEAEQTAAAPKSSRSNASCYSTVSKDSQAVKGVQMKKPKTIEELQNRIESLVQSSIQLLKKQKHNIGLAKMSQLRKAPSLDQDFKQITEYFNELRVQAEQNQGSSQKLKDLNKKIELLQRMMASQSIESELLKHQYSNWKNQRGNTSSFSSKKLLADASRFNRDSKGMFNTRKETKPGKQKEAVTQFGSTSNFFFQKPGKEFYLAPKQKNSSYCLNRQPMERSSYSAQYFDYGHIPTYNHKAGCVRQFPESSLAVKASTYQHQYKEKHGLTKNINIKDLDCTRDKFKNPNVSFMASSKKVSGPSQSQLRRGQKEGQRQMQKEGNQGQVVKEDPKQVNAESTKENMGGRGYESSLIGCMNLSASGNNAKSEHSSAFVWHNYSLVESLDKDEIILSQIKDRKLIKMKETFKAMAMRN